MSVNSSSSNEPLMESHLSFINSFYPAYLHCYTTGTSSIVYTSFLITHICLLLPLCSFILQHGHQQWQLNRSSCSAVVMSHSDCFMYHMVTMELISVVGCAVSCVSIYTRDFTMLTVGTYTVGFNWVGGIVFHVLICLERYLAVSHPITYLNLRNERGVRIRNVSAGLVWLFCFNSLVLATYQVFTCLEIVILVISLTTVSFCSVSVLWILIRPRPGDKTKDRERIHQSKQKAFNTIIAILGVLVVKFVFNITWEVLVLSAGNEPCVILTCCSWFNLPANLVLPLLFLNRAGKFMCIRNIFK